MPNPATVCAVTLNWNRADDTAACVQSLVRSHYKDLLVVVCDNASNENCVSDLREQLLHSACLVRGSVLQEIDVADVDASADRSGTPAIVLLHTGSNLGFAGGMNVGIRYAMSRHEVQFVWLINNDAVVDPQALTAVVERASLDQSIGICGSTLIDWEDRSRIQALGGATYAPWSGRPRAVGAFSRTTAIPANPEAIEKQLAYVNGASMLVSRRFIETAGLMDESYFLYSEEHDWAYRARSLGFRLGYAPLSRVYHKHGATIGTAPSGGSEQSLFYLFRARAMFTARHYRMLLPAVLLWMTWDALKFALKGQPRKARAALSGMLAARTGAAFH